MTSNVFYRQVKWMYILFFCLSPALSLRSGTGILAILVILAMWTERERERENISHFAASGKKAMEAKAKRITYR